MTPDEFRDIRTRLGLSPTDLARRLGYAHASHVRALESQPTSKAHRPVPHILALLMRAYEAGYLPDD